jgi:hypothetical protein
MPCMFSILLDSVFYLQGNYQSRRNRHFICRFESRAGSASRRIFRAGVSLALSVRLPVTLSQCASFIFSACLRFYLRFILYFSSFSLHPSLFAVSNCNTFSEELSQRLLGYGLPGYITRLSRLGQVRLMAPINSQNTVTKIIRFHTCTHTRIGSKSSDTSLLFSIMNNAENSMAR